MNTKQLYERGIEIFTYLELSAPDLPEDDATTLQEEFRRLQNIVKLASDYVKTEDAKRYLGFCSRDLDKSLSAYEKDNEDHGLDYLNSAREWFDDSRKDKKSRPTFIVGPDGQAEKT